MEKVNSLIMSNGVSGEGVKAMINCGGPNAWPERHARKNGQTNIT